MLEEICIDVETPKTVCIHESAMLEEMNLEMKFILFYFVFRRVSLASSKGTWKLPDKGSMYAWGLILYAQGEPAEQMCRRCRESPA